MLRLEHIAPARHDEQRGCIAHDDEGFEVAEEFVGAPVLGQFHSRAHQMALMFFKLCLEALEQGAGCVAIEATVAR